MSTLMSQLWTSEVQTAFTVFLVFLAILYVFSVVWVVRDAYLRGSLWVLWAIVALIPLLGLIVYLLLRPPLFQIDRDEQELEIAIKQRQLMQYGECANCGYPVEADYVLCPSCQVRLKNLCHVCNHALDPSWPVCPYCATPVSENPGVRRSHAARPAETVRLADEAPSTATVKLAGEAGVNTTIKLVGEADAGAAVPEGAHTTTE